MTLHCPDCGKPMYQGTSDLWWCQDEACAENERAGEWSWCEMCQEIRREDEMHRPLGDRCCRVCHITHYEGAELACDPWLHAHLQDLLDHQRVRRKEVRP